LISFRVFSIVKPSHALLSGQAHNGKPLMLECDLSSPAQ